MPLAQAEQWPDLLRIVREKVKPERELLDAKNSTNIGRRERWWLFGGYSAGLQLALKTMTRCLVIPQQYPNRVRVSFQPADRVFSQKLIAIVLDEWSSFAVLQSGVHEAWSALFCGRMGAANTPVYSSSDCFETFPFPQPDPRTVIPALEDVGQRLYDTRAAYMVETQQGLTQTYNKLKDPACHDAPIVELRRLHEEMDRAVLDAYGWTDIVVPPFCPATVVEQKALETFQDQVIDRLFVLNAERAEEERRAGLGKAAKEKAAKEKPKGGKKAGKKSEGGEGPQGELF
jgi:hypothetical protein